jgi:hypothetical protein
MTGRSRTAAMIFGVAMKEIVDHARAKDNADPAGYRACALAGRGTVGGSCCSGATGLMEGSAGS